MLEWEEHQIDYLLDKVLKSDSVTEYRRTSVETSRMLFGKLQNEADNVDQLLRRRAHRRTEYTDPTNARSRVWRGGLPWTWSELRVLHWCTQKEVAESSHPVSVEYIGRLLQRPCKEIEDIIMKRATEKFGIKGFDL